MRHTLDSGNCQMAISVHATLAFENRDYKAASSNNELRFILTEANPTPSTLDAVFAHVVVLLAVHRCGPELACEPVTPL